MSEAARLKHRISVLEKALQAIHTDTKWADDMHARHPKALRYALQLNRQRAADALADRGESR